MNVTTDRRIIAKGLGQIPKVGLWRLLKHLESGGHLLLNGGLWAKNQGFG